MLEIKDLTIQYGEKDAVVENFSLTMEKDEIISIVGESGKMCIRDSAPIAQPPGKATFPLFSMASIPPITKNEALIF